MRIEERVKEYRAYLSSFCYYLALITLINERIETGALTGGEYLADALENLEYYQGEFLRAREALGLPVESAFEAFQGNFSFFGFSIKEGRFEGDVSKVEPILDKNCCFKNGVPTSEEALKYEVGVYAYMCAKGAKNLFVEYCNGGTCEQKVLKTHPLTRVWGVVSSICRKLACLVIRDNKTEMWDDWDAEVS